MVLYSTTRQVTVWRLGKMPVIPVKPNTLWPLVLVLAVCIKVKIPLPLVTKLDTKIKAAVWPLDIKLVLVEPCTEV